MARKRRERMEILLPKLHRCGAFEQIRDLFNLIPMTRHD
jgi:hypothetical protein